MVGGDSNLAVSAFLGFPADANRLSLDFKAVLPFAEDLWVDAGADSGIGIGICIYRYRSITMILTPGGYIEI